MTDFPGGGRFLTQKEYDLRAVKSDDGAGALVHVEIDAIPMFERFARLENKRLEMPAIVKRFHALAPMCSVCTRRETAAAGHPRHIPVESALIVKDVTYYFAIVRCHGAHGIVNISATADGMPSDAKIRTTLAFKE